MSSRVIKRGMTVLIKHDYDVFDNNANGMRAVVLRPYSVDRVSATRGQKTRIIKHLVYIEEIDYYCEPRDEWLEIIE